MGQVTRILSAIEQGDPHAAELGQPTHFFAPAGEAMRRILTSVAAANWDRNSEAAMSA